MSPSARYFCTVSYPEIDWRVTPGRFQVRCTFAPIVPREELFGPSLYNWLGLKPATRWLLPSWMMLARKIVDEPSRLRPCTLSNALNVSLGLNSNCTRAPQSL